MPHDYHIIEIRRQGLPAGRSGTRLHVQLSGRPTRRWTRGLTARLASELSGSGSGIRFSRLVQGEQLVLEVTQTRDAEVLIDALRRAVAAINHPHQPRSPGLTRASAMPLPAIDHALDAPAWPNASERSPAGNRSHPSAWFG